MDKGHSHTTAPSSLSQSGTPGALLPASDESAGDEVTEPPIRDSRIILNNDIEEDDDTEESASTKHDATVEKPQIKALAQVYNSEVRQSKSDSELKEKADFPQSSTPIPGVRRAPTAPNPTTLSAPGGIAVLASGQQTPYNLGDEHAAGRPPLRDLLLRPQKKLASDAGLTWLVAGRNLLTASWLNVMLIFIPVSWALHFSGQSDTIVFVFSFLAIVPLASLLGFATEQLALRVGDSLGGLLNATFGNAVELLISILALVKGELDIVQSSMIGSILSNTLLVLGMCFFAGGVRFHEQGYGVRAAQLNISLLGIAVAAIVLPAAFHFSRHGVGVEPEGRELTELLSISRGIAVLLLMIYVGYLMFQLYTHAYLFRVLTPYQRRRLESLAPSNGIASPPGSQVFRRPNWVPSNFGGSDSSSSTASVRSRRISTQRGHRGEGEEEMGGEQTSMHSVDESEEEEEELEVPKVTAIQAMVILLGVTVITGITAEWLIDSIDGLTQTGAVSREFVALILLPLVGNAAEHVTAVMVSVKDKIDLSLSIAVGSSIQVALFVVPFLVLLAWAIGQPLTMQFDPFETIVLFISVLIVNFAISDGKTNWMEGVILMTSYIIIALITWFYDPLV